MGPCCYPAVDLPVAAFAFVLLLLLKTFIDLSFFIVSSLIFQIGSLYPAQDGCNHLLFKFQLSFCSNLAYLLLLSFHFPFEILINFNLFFKILQTFPQHLFLLYPSFFHFHTCAHSPCCPDQLEYIC
jgi:hypothetical protein